MKYQELLDSLSRLSPEQLQYDVEIEVAQEYSNLTEIYPASFYVVEAKTEDDHSFFNDGHPVICIEV